MADYIDQLFEANKQKPPTGPTGVDLEQALIKDNQTQAPPQQPQSPQGQQKPQAQAPTQTRQQTRTVDSLFGMNPATGLDSVGKFLEERVFIPAADAIDNLQGNKKTPDQIGQDRQQQRLQGQQQLQAIDQRNNDSAPEPMRAVRGAIRGAAESTLNTAEFAGDAFQTLNPFRMFPTISGPAYQIPDKDNVLSNKYEWARWDLGRDDVGAKTPVGKAAQDILEFVMLAAPTGGFGALRGIGGKLVSTPGILGKTGVLLKSGGYQALRSSPAELAMALRGEGNLSNTLREIGLPEWSTPLAVDKNDSGATLAAKGLLEAGLTSLPFSFAADGLEALFKGRRAFSAAKKAGITDEEAGAQAVQEVQEALRDSMPNAQSGHMTPDDYQNAVSYNNTHHPGRSWRVEPVAEEVLANGRPVANDGVAGVLDNQGGLHGIVIDPGSSQSDLGDFFTRARAEGVSNFSLYRAGNPAIRDLNDILEELGYREVATSSPDLESLRARGLSGVRSEFADQTDFAASGPRISHYVLDPAGDMPAATYFQTSDEGLNYQRMLAQQLGDIDVGPINNINEVRRLPAQQQLLWYDRQPAQPGLFDELGVQAQISREGRANRTVKLPNGTNVRFTFWPHTLTNEQNVLNSVKAIEVEFGVTGGGLDEYGKRLVTWFNRVARDEIEPGTVLVNTPASNNYGRGRSEAQLRRESANPEFRRRETLYRRAGFSQGLYDRGGYVRQYAVVRDTPTGSGKFLEPLKVTLGEGEGDRGWHGFFGNVDEIHRQVLAQQNPFVLANRFLSLSGTLNAARSAGVHRLIRNSNMGIPVTWDDVAAVTPELFTPGTRDMAQFAPDLQRYFDVLENGADDSYFIDPFTNQSVREGFAVAIDGVSLTDFSQEAIESFVARYEGILSRTDTALEVGVRDGGLYVQPVRLIGDQLEATGLGRLYDQPRITNLADLRQHDTFGVDNLRNTQGQHIASTYGVPVEPRLVTPTEALADQLNAESLLNGRRTGRRTVTQAQIRQIASASSDGAGNIMRRLVRDNPIDLEELSQISRRSEQDIVMDAWQGMQDALDENFNVDLNQLLTQEVGDEVLLSRAGIVQVRGLMQELANQMHESAGPIMSMIDNNVDAVPAFARLADNLKALMRIHKVSANVYGNMLRAYQIPVPLLGGVSINVPSRVLSPEALGRELRNADQQLDGIVRRMADADPEARQAGYRLLNALVMAQGDVSKMATLGKWMDKLFIGKAFNIFYNSVLAGPKTQLTNIVSGLVNTIYRPIAAATGGNTSIKKAAAASFYNLHQTVYDSFDIAWRSLKDGAVNEGDKGILEAAETDIQMQILRKSAEVSDDMGLKAGVGMLDMMDGLTRCPWLNWPSKLLTGGDEFFKTMVSRMEYNSRVMMKAIEESAGTDDPVKEVFERLYKDSYDRTFDPDTGKILDDDLLNIAKETTFQTDLEGWAKSFGDFVTAVPPLRIFFPFVKTGHNIMVYAGTHVPVLGKHLSEYKAVMAGEDEYSKAVMRGRQAWGTMLVLGAALAAHNGMITGNGPPDPEERKLWEKQHPPRSIRIGNYWVDYSRIEPFGWLLSSVADIYDFTKRGRLSEDRGQYLAGYITYAIAANFTNKSYMQGVVPLGRLLTPGWQGIQVLTTLPVDTINSFLPMSGLRSTFANMLTPYKQEFNGLIDRSLYRASGGFAKVGSPMYDWLDGSLVEAPNGGFNALNPLAIRTRKQDVVRDALEDIEFDNTIISKTLSGVKLGREHRSRMQQIMGNSGLHKELEQWVTNPNFGSAVRSFKARLSAGERVYKENEPFYDEIVRIILRHRDAAVDQVKRESPELQGDIRERQVIRDSQRRPQSDSSTIDLDRIVNMPK
jgi:hypothetical protein